MIQICFTHNLKIYGSQEDALKFHDNEKEYDFINARLQHLSKLFMDNINSAEKEIALRLGDGKFLTFYYNSKNKNNPYIFIYDIKDNSLSDIVNINQFNKLKNDSFYETLKSITVKLSTLSLDYGQIEKFYELASNYDAQIDENILYEN